MKRFFDAELDAFRTTLVSMGTMAIGQVQESIAALIAGDIGRADRVIAADDELDQLEMKIDDEAVRFMGLRAPVASELRLVIVGMKASHDLERVGDEAVGIARRTVRLSVDSRPPEFDDIPRMADVVLEMLREALDCLLNTDAARAELIIRRDAEVDTLNKQIYHKLTKAVAADPRIVTSSIELMFISKSLERIADHATNIAEEVIFLTEGRDVRHRPELKRASSGGK